MSFFGRHRPVEVNDKSISGLDGRNFGEIYNRYFPELYLYLRLFT